MEELDQTHQQEDSAVRHMSQMSIESKRKQVGKTTSRLESVASQEGPALSMGDIEAATFGDGNSDQDMADRGVNDDQIDLAAAGSK